MIHELILSPGDARLRLLEWLIVRYQKLIIMTYNSNTGNVYIICCLITGSTHTLGVL